MSREKIDTANNLEAKDRAEKALEKLKAIERKFKGSMQTIVMPNGAKISSTNKERLTEYIESYDKL
jgi:hypothetical protein